MARKTKKTLEEVPPPPPPAESPKTSKSLAFAIEAARALADDKCEDVALLDVRGLSQICDYIVIGSGSSDRQMRSAADETGRIGATMGYPPVRQNVDDRTTWHLVDFVDVIVHVFEPNTRAYYDIEMMWGDAPRIDWKRPAGEAQRPRGTRISPAKGTSDGEEAND